MPSQQCGVEPGSVQALSIQSHVTLTLSSFVLCWLVSDLGPSQGAPAQQRHSWWAPQVLPVPTLPTHLLGSDSKPPPISSCTCLCLIWWMPHQLERPSSLHPVVLWLWHLPCSRLHTHGLDLSKPVTQRDPPLLAYKSTLTQPPSFPPSPFPSFAPNIC